MESQYPEHEKLAKVKDQSQLVGEFLDWLADQGVYLASEHEHKETCKGNDGWNDCGYRDSELVQMLTPREKLLARFFNINLETIDQEKEQMLADLCAAQKSCVTFRLA